ncbi:TMEM175 family protein [Longimicrobium sp.]|uniref:TMEM175 family protein n=1 Tax=Longimicrobium sp. TaxID=2029185 RepID=UPI002C578346|nr:TMEM175 family protein [Longimicrobium sp.]HSU15130.1 TMEM175 family protein [Longimicrobium sp.]
MLRQHLVQNAVRGDDSGFRWRGTEVSRLEALSDAVFGFAITLLVVSLEPPRTFDQLMVAVRGFFTFAACFALLFMVWLNQYRWFRRYGLEDAATVWLNAILLFVIVFFVYPLKFVFGLVVGKMMGGQGNLARLADGTVVPIFTAERQGVTMMLIFGGGYMAVFLIFALMYGHAWRRRDALRLDELERYETRDNIRETLMHAGIGVLSVALSLRFGSLEGGLTYMLVAPVMTAHGFISGAGRRRLVARLAREHADADTAPPREPQTAPM